MKGFMEPPLNCGASKHGMIFFLTDIVRLIANSAINVAFCLTTYHLWKLVTVANYRHTGTGTGNGTDFLRKKQSLARSHLSISAQARCGPSSHIHTDQVNPEWIKNFRNSGKEDISPVICSHFIFKNTKLSKIETSIGYAYEIIIPNYLR